MSEIISKWKTMIKVFRISKIKHIEEKSGKKKSEKHSGTQSKVLT